jgi:predicted DNA-binding transcriptional regulator YafY
VFCDKISLSKRRLQVRADRLLAMLILLQRRGRMPASQLAKELEVSQRTIYRDVVALSAAGVPVYAETGRDGGYALIDSYRTSLTGLNDGEVRALFMLSIPAPLEQLGLGQELRSALLKLSAALPASGQQAEERARQRFHLDSNWWRQAEEPVPHLQTVQTAVWGDARLQIVYRLPPGMTIEQEIEPYGLVAKAGVWHLVYFFRARPRVLRVSQLLEVRRLDATFDRTAGFDLAAFWETWCSAQERGQQAYTVRLRLAPELLPWLPSLFGGWVSETVAAAQADARGWLTFELQFESLEAARSRLLGLGGAVEVLAPVALRLSMQDYARQIANLYGQPSAEGR